MTTEDYISALAVSMGLGDWLLLVGEPLAADSGNYATVKATWGTKEAVIRLCPEWGSLSPETQRRVIVHELGHLFTDRLATWVRCWLEELSPSARRLAEGMLSEEVEYATDAVMRALAPLLPLPTDEVRWEGTD